MRVIVTICLLFFIAELAFATDQNHDHDHDSDERETCKECQGKCLTQFHQDHKVYQYILCCNTCQLVKDCIHESDGDDHEKVLSEVNSKDLLEETCEVCLARCENTPSFLQGTRSFLSCALECAADRPCSKKIKNTIDNLIQADQIPLELDRCEQCYYGCAQSYKAHDFDDYHRYEECANDCDKEYCGETPPGGAAASSPGENGNLQNEIPA